MLKKIKLFVLVCMVSAFGLITAGCSFNKSNESAEHSIYFMSNGEYVAEVKTKGEEKIVLPTLENEGYLLEGWYYSQNDSTEEFTENTLLEQPLSANIVVFAKWQSLDPYNIIVISVSGDTINNADYGYATISGESQVQDANIGMSYDLVANTNAGYYFVGWYLLESSTQTVSDFNATKLLSTSPNYTLEIKSGAKYGSSNSSVYGKGFIYAKFAKGISYRLRYQDQDTSDKDTLHSTPLTEQTFREFFDGLLEEFNASYGKSYTAYKTEVDGSVKYLTYVYNGHMYIEGDDGHLRYTYRDASGTDVEEDVTDEFVDFSALNSASTNKILLYYFNLYYTLTFKYYNAVNYVTLSSNYINYLQGLSQNSVVTKTGSYKSYLSAGYRMISIDYKISFDTGVIIPTNYDDAFSIPSNASDVKLYYEGTDTEFVAPSDGETTNGLIGNYVVEIKSDYDLSATIDVTFKVLKNYGSFNSVLLAGQYSSSKVSYSVTSDSTYSYVTISYKVGYSIASQGGAPTESLVLKNSYAVDRLVYSSGTTSSYTVTEFNNLMVGVNFANNGVSATVSVAIKL